MKPPLISTLVILAVGIVWGVRENQRLATLREQHRLLTQHAAAHGIPVDPASPFVLTNSGKRPHADGGRKAKAVADLVVAFDKEMMEILGSGQRLDAAAQQRIMEWLDGLLSLNGGEFRILFDELRNRDDMDDRMKQGMVPFSIEMLAELHPQAALALFTESSDLLDENPRLKHMLPSALSHLAKDQPLAALEWIKNNAEKYPELVTDEARRAVIAGAALSDFGLALQLIGELGVSADKGGLMLQISQAAVTPERRTDFLTALRQQVAASPDQAEAGKLYAAGLRNLLDRVAESGYDPAMAWLETAGLPVAESAGLMENLSYRQTKAETGKWLDWMATQPVKDSQSDSTTRDLVRNWTQNDYRAAGEWLTQAPAGPLKEAATLSYLETIAPYEPEVAAQWATTLPADRQKDALQTIYQKLGTKDKAAAADFATRHGLEP
jgi:hypothetical protein